MSVMDNTPSFDNEPLSPQDNRSVEPLNDEAARSAPQLEDIPAAPQQPEEPKRPVDPRAEHLERLAEDRNRKRQEELSQIDNAFGRQKPEAPQAPPAENDYVDLKVRKQTQRMTVKERDGILADDWDADDIRSMSEAEKNRNAQMILAQRAYKQEIDALKEQVNKPQVIQQTVQQPPADQTQPEPPKSPREAVQEKLNKALEDLEFGVEGARTRVIEAQNELSDIAANEAIQRSRQAEIANSYDGEVRSAYAEVVSSDVYKSNLLAIGAFDKALEYGMRRSIADCLNSQPAHVQEAFLRQGITPDYLGKAPAQNIAGLYKDMAMKGYSIHRPAALIKAVERHVSSQIAGNTAPASQSQHPGTDSQNGNHVGVDRSDRKAEIQNQPVRAGVPRPQPGSQPAPVSEQERRQAVIQEEKAKRRGVPVR